MTPRLPRLAAFLLRVTVPERWADSIADDFELEWRARRAHSRAPRAAAVRITLEATAVAVRFSIERLLGSAEAIRCDVRESARALRHRPAYGVAATGVIALGVALNTTAFTIVDRVLLSPLPFREPQHLIELRARAADGSDTRTVSSVDVEVWSEALAPVVSVAAFQVEPMVVTAPHQAPVPVVAAHATHNLFDVLGVRAAMGRTFEAGEGKLGSPGAAVVAAHVWRARFPGTASPIGQPIDVGGRGSTVVGMVPAGVEFPPGVGVWLARETSGARLRDLRIEFASLQVVGRLHGETTFEAAAEDIGRLGTHAAVTASRDATPVAVPLHDALVGPTARVLRLAWAGVFFLFLMACANAAGLLVSRIASRGREFQVRASLGATRLRLVRHASVEGAILATVGASAGVGLAAALLRVFNMVNAGRVPMANNLAIEGASVAFAIGLVLMASAVIAGTAAVAMAQPATASWSTGGALVATQLGLCVALLVTATLTGAGVMNALRQDPGFDPDHVLVLSVQPRPSVARQANTAAAYRPLLEQMTSIGGVESAAISDHLPPLAYGRFAPLMFEGETASAAAYAEPVRQVGVTAAYFRALRIPIVAGRAFTDTEVAAGGAVAVIDERLARRAGGVGVVGRHLLIDGRAVEIVGVAANARLGATLSPDEQTLYQPLGSGAYAAGDATFLMELHVIVRTEAGDAHVPAAIHAAAVSAAEVVSLRGISTLADRLRAPLAGPAFHATLFGVLAVLGGALAALGVYGLVTHVVQRATRELGVRLALGASRAGVVWLVTRRGLSFAIIGLAIGLATAPAVAAAAASRLEGAAAPDALLYTAACAALLLVVAAGCIVPAWRASRVDPVMTLKCE